MELTPDAKLLQNLFRKRDLLQRGDPAHEKIRTVLLLLGGGPGGGAVSSGHMRAFYPLGLQDCFDVIIGVSAGAGVGAYFLSGWGRALAGMTVFMEECTTLRYFNPFRLPMADTDFIESVFRTGPKALDVPAVLTARSDLFVVVSDADDGSDMLVNAKRARPDLITAVKAAISPPGIDGRPVKLNGRLVLDGIANPLPAQEVLERFQPTDLLIVPNCTEKTWRTYAPSPAERMLGRLLLRKHPFKVRQAVESRFRRFHKNRRFLEELDSTTIGALFAPHDVRGFGWSGRHFRQAADAATKATLKLFAAAASHYHRG